MFYNTHWQPRSQGLSFLGGRRERPWEQGCIHWENSFKIISRYDYSHNSCNLLFYAFLLEFVLTLWTGIRRRALSVLPCSRTVCFLVKDILIPKALFASLSQRGLGTRNEGLWGHRVSSPRFLDFRSSCMQ